MKLISNLKALFKQCFPLKKNLSCMALHAISVFGKVWKLNPEKIALQKHR